MNTLPAQHENAPSRRTPNAWAWRLMPAFWTVLFIGMLALLALGAFAGHPERISRWRGVGFWVLLLAVAGGYCWLSWGRIYRDEELTARQAMLPLAAQVLGLLALVGWYDTSFAWLSIALLYQILGGLPRSYWPVLLGGVLLVCLVGAWPSGRMSGLDGAWIVTFAIVCASNFGIAFFIRLLQDQRAELRGALAQVEAANAALAASAAQGEELAVLRERSRLARAMHDNLGHALVVMNVKLEAAQLLYARDTSRGDAELAATRDLIRTTMTELRRALANLRSPAVDGANLPGELRKLAREAQARVGYAVLCEVAPEAAALPTDAREALWYVAREALANVERHAAASRATLSLARERDGWLLRVSDDGLGLDPADLQRPGHYGVLGMRERLGTLGGTLEVRRGVGGGTVVEARVPATEAS